MRIAQVGSPISKDNKLWRYFDFQKFLSLIIERSLFFNRMDKMEDLNEGISINQLLWRYGDEIEKELVRKAKEVSRRKELELKMRQRIYFLSCWFVHHRESVAMWNSYSNSDGIALKIGAHDLINSITEYSTVINNGDKLKTLYHGFIDYKDFFNPIDRKQFKDEIEIIGFQKDESFKHENEYRFLIKQDLKNFNEDELPHIKLMLNNFKKLKFDLVFHPKMENWKKENIKNVLAALKVHNCTIRDSELKLKEW